MSAYIFEPFFFANLFEQFRLFDLVIIAVTAIMVVFDLVISIH